VPAWPTTSATADVVTLAAKAGKPVDAYLTVLPPVDLEAVVPHAVRLREAGATRFSLYRLGLAPRWRQPLLGDITRAAR
jgi:hypothetical protein